MYAILFTLFNDDGSITYKLRGPYTRKAADLLVKYDDSDYDDAVIVKVEA